MKIATWNIRGVIERTKLLLYWLDENKPDLVALQKINVPEKEFPTKVFARAGYYANTHSYANARDARGDYGVAILSRNKPRRVKKGLPDQEALGPRIVTVEVDGLEFSSVYAPAGKKGDLQPKLDWFGSLNTHFRARRSRVAQQVLCGDFNVVSDCRVRPAESREKPLTCGENVREKFRAFLNLAGLFDLYTHRTPEGWEDPFVFRGRSGCLKFSRLEYVLGTQAIVRRDPVVKFDVDHAIVKNTIYYWVRAPIIAHFHY